MQPTPPCSTPTCWWQMQVLRIAVTCIICVFYLFFTPGYVALWNSKTPHRPAGEKVSWCLETSSLLQLPPQDGSVSLTLLSLFLSFIFCPTSFQRQGAAFLGVWPRAYCDWLFRRHTSITDNSSQYSGTSRKVNSSYFWNTRFVSVLWSTFVFYHVSKLICIF